MPKPREHRIHELLAAVHRAGRLDAYAYAEEAWGADPRALADARAAAEELVAQKLARYVDEPRTTLALTPFGRYWSADGGYLAFLRADAAGPAKPAREGGGEDAGMDPAMRRELQAMRLDLTRKRLKTFWWGFGLSLAAFVLSVISLYLAITGRR